MLNPKQFMSIAAAKRIGDPNVPWERLRSEDRGYLDNLKTQISAEGLKDPIRVTEDLRMPGGQKIHDGHHRVLALEELGHEQVPWVQHVEPRRKWE